MEHNLLMPWPALIGPLFFRHGRSYDQKTIQGGNVAFAAGNQSVRFYLEGKLNLDHRLSGQMPLVPLLRHAPPPLSAEIVASCHTLPIEV
jgi:hypothetical protein